MKPKFSPLRQCVPALLILSGQSLLAETRLQITDPDPFEAYAWFNAAIWDNGAPGPGEDVVMEAQSNEFGPVDVGLFLDNTSSTIGSLDIRYGVTLDVTDANFAVTGDTYAEGFLGITRGTMSLGTNTQYDAGTKTLNGGQCLVDDGNSASLTIYQWHGADIEINKGGFNLFGTNVLVRNQDTGIDAFQNLRENSGFLTMDDGYVMSISGNFTNTSNGSITLNLNESVRTPRLEIAGNFINDGLVEVMGNSVLNVSGGLSGAGRIVVTGTGNQVSVVGVYTQNGGEVDLGAAGSGIDSFTLKAMAHVYDGGAVVKGTGTLEGDVTITSGTLSPGTSPGQIQVEGDLTLEENSVLEMEIGGTVPETGYDRIVQMEGDEGTALGGLLVVSMISGVDRVITAGDTFEILTSDLPLEGAFSNVESGSRVYTKQGRGSFLVEYGAGAPDPAKVVLSAYQPEAQSFSAWTESYGVPGADADPLDDPNGDGVTNIEAYFRGMSPVGSGEPTAYAAVVAGGSVQITMTGSKSVENVTVKTQISSDLIHWSPGPDPALVSETLTQKLLGITLPVGPGLPQFARFLIEPDSE
ncbi:MAG: hypothetical protein V4689_22465 [Verrucomicrobiota bacterium]